MAWVATERFCSIRELSVLLDVTFLSHVFRRSCCVQFFKDCDFGDTARRFYYDFPIKFRDWAFVVRQVKPHRRIVVAILESEAEFAFKREACLDVVQSNVILLCIDYKCVWSRQLVLVFRDVIEDKSKRTAACIALLALRGCSLHFQIF